MAVDNTDIVDWLECVSAIETNKGVIYFCNEELFNLPNVDTTKSSCPADSDNRIEVKFGDIEIPTSSQKKTPAYVYESRTLLKPVGDFQSYFPWGHFLYSLTAYNPMNQQRSVLENFACNQRLQDELKEHLPGCKVLNNFSYFPHRPHHFERGFTVVLPLDYPLEHEKIVFNLSMKYRQAAYFKCRILHHGDTTQKLVLLEDDGKEIEEKLVVVERLSYHPAYLHQRNNSVYHAYEEAVNILSQCHHIPEARELLEISRQYIPSKDQRNVAHPVIVLEGLEKIGVAYQSQQLSKCINATHLQSPPVCIRHLYKTFADQDELTKGAFFSIGNYILSHQIAKQAKKSTVIVDRYWNSSAAFTIASEVGCGSANLPPKGHFVYNWPEDLIKPTAVILLSSKNVTQSRCQMIYATFRRMKNSSWIEIDKVKDHGLSRDALTVKLATKLHDKRVISFCNSSSKDRGLCPSLLVDPDIRHNYIDPVHIGVEIKKKNETPLEKFDWGPDNGLILY